MRKFLIILALIGIGIIGLGASDCDGGEGEKQRKEAVEERFDQFARAESKYGEPKLENFPLREALVEFTVRQDMVNHPWYIYILADTGNIIGYYVGKTVPVNACNFLSSTESVRDDDDGNLITTAPSLDGIFYGGGGASAGCDAWFFFDAATNALVQIRGVNFFSADQPLRLEAEPITVAQ